MIAGAGAPSTFWFEGFIQGLASAGYHVICYDNRDCGYSTHLPVAQNLYTIHDLAQDAQGVLDAYGIEQAHIIGHSMGGHIVQALALSCPERVKSLVIMSATGGFDPEIPQIAPAVLEALTANHLTQNFNQDLPQFMMLWQLLHGSRPIDEDLAIAYTRSLYERESEVKLAASHMAAVAMIGYIRDKLAGIKQKTLIIHGDHDNMQAIEGARILAQEIPQATLCILQEAGHMFFSYQLWKEILDAVLEHLKGAS